MRFGRNSDELLMREAQSGDYTSFNVLIRRNANRLLTMIVRLVGDYHIGEDLFQELVLLVWQKRDQYQYPKPVQQWLYKIALNLCRQHWRSSKKSDSLGELDPVGIRFIEPDASTERDELADAIKAAIQLLPQQQRAVVVLRIWSGMSYAEISETVGASESTVRSYMHHSLIKLRSSLARFVN